MDYAFLIIRLLVGLAMAAHGSQKLFGWFRGYGLAGTGGFFEQLGFRPGKTFALLAGLGEFAGGLLTALGLLGALGPALIVLVMTVAALSVHVRNGFFATGNGYELNVIYAASALAIAFAGSGAFSLDRLFGLSLLAAPAQAAITIAVAIVIGALNTFARRPSTAPEAQHS
jgi:putative oxidoreductase